MQKLILLSILVSASWKSWADDHCQLIIHNKQRIDDVVIVRESRIHQSYQFNYIGTCDKHRTITGIQVIPPIQDSTQRYSSVEASYTFNHQRLDAKDVRMDMTQAGIHRYYFENAKQQPQEGRKVQGTLTVTLSGLFLDSETINVTNTMELVLLTEH